jgi:hypothetical protein
MNINEAYRFVQFISNKNQRGNIKPDDFNLAAQRAQMDLFMQRYGNPTQYQYGSPKARVQWQDSRKVTDDLKEFLVEKQFILNEGKVSYPSDYSHLSSARGSFIENGENCGDSPIIDATNVDLVNDNELAYRLSSFIDSPSHRYPVLAFYDKYMQVYPKDMQTITLTYLRRPQSPLWAYTITNNNPVYNPTLSINFEMPEDTHNEICYRILSYLGINLRDGELSQYAEKMKQTGGE